MKATLSLDDFTSKLKTTLKEKGYVVTHQRELILEQLHNVESHFDIEEFFESLKKRKIPVSRATVYRTIACLEKIGCIRKTNLDEAHAHFEMVYGENVHHEHMRCRKCGKVTEFSFDHLEKHIQSIARSYNFHINSHSLEIFGICADCCDREASEEKKK